MTKQSNGRDLFDRLTVLIRKLNPSANVHTWDECTDGWRAAWEEFAEVVQAPIPMRLICERCGELHIDEGEFATRPHHTHSCQFCGLTWRPAKVATVGVRFIPGFKNEEAPRG